MENFNFNLSELTSDSVNNLSDISFSTDSKPYRQQGGFFGLFSSKNNKVDNVALKLARNGDKNGFLDFLINEDLITSFKTQDENGNTILHYLLMSSNPSINLIKKILARSDAKSFVNKQNKNGDTPLLVALKYGNHDLCTSLIDHGANKTIKNKKGEYIETETPYNGSENDFGTDYLKMSEPDTEPQTAWSLGKLFTLQPIKNKNNDNDNVTMSTISVSSYKPGQLLLNSETDHNSDIMKKFVPSKAPQSSEPMSLKMTATENPTELNSEKVNAFVQKFMNDTTQSDANLDKDIAAINHYLEKQSGGGCGCSTAPDNTNTEYLMNAIENYFGNQSGGNCTNTEYMLKSIENRFMNNSAVDTETLLQTIEKRFHKQSGGATKNKTKVKGTRKISNTQQNDRSDELARMITSQTDEIIARVIQQILNILEENKKKFKGIEVTEDWAKIYKSALWKKVRDENPDMKNPLDIAVKMEQITDLDTLTSFKPKFIKDLADQIEKHRKEKEEKRKEKGTYEKKPRAANNDEAVTSSDEVPSPTADYSETSY